MFQYAFTAPGTQHFSTLGHFSPHPVTFVQSADTLPMTQQGEPCNEVDISDSFHHFLPADKTLFQNATLKTTQVSLFTPQMLQTLQSPPTQTTISPPMQTPMSPPIHMQNVTATIPTQPQQIQETYQQMPASTNTSLCSNQQEISQPYDPSSVSPTGQIEDYSQAAQPMQWTSEPNVTQYLALVKETAKLREEVNFWKRIAKQQSKYSLVKDEEARKLKSQLDEIEVSHLLMKKLYSAEVESSSRSKLLQLRTIKRLVDENFEEMEEFQAKKTLMKDVLF